ncbi:VC0807 family protein [Spongiactinospora sp. 9N601]|uniref:VC0807 family protein n=1 Tax=Spongiactinospora sp. 9N601 TaxID=3375149 RepID=UPI0037BDFF38
MTVTARANTQDADNLAVLRLPPAKVLLHAAVPKILLDGLLPTAVYYTLRLLGADDLTAILAGAGVAVVRALAGVVLHRCLSSVAVVILVMFLVGLLGAWVTDDPRFVVVKESIPMVLGGVACLITLTRRRPAAFHAVGALLAAGDPDRRAAWRTLWAATPRLRAATRVLTLVWGLVLSAEAAVSTVTVYLNPMDVAVGLHMSIKVLALGLVAAWSAWYLRRVRVTLLT